MQCTNVIKHVPNGSDYVYRMEHIWMQLRRPLPTLLQVLSDGEDMRLLADQVKGRGN